MTSVDRLDSSRIEDRFLIDSEKSSNLWNFIESNYEVLRYSEPWVLTVYFAGISTVDRMPKALRDASVSIKARAFLQEEIPGNSVFVDPNSLGRFEVKYRSRKNPHSPRRRKYSAHGMNFSDIFLALNKGNYESFFKRNELFPAHLLSDILRKCSCVNFVPVGFVHYLRRHFVENNPIATQPFRGTYDTDISFWSIDWANYVYAASRVGEYPGSILEMKSVDGRIPEELQLVIDESKKDQPLPSKHDLIFSVIPPRHGMYQETPYREVLAGWDLMEIERKIDVDQDPRPWLRELDFGDNFVLHTPDEQVTRHVFLESSHSVCITEYMSIKRPPSVKAKKTAPSLGYVKREEVSREDTPTGRREISEFLGENIDSLPKCTPCQRNRTLRMLISNKTRRVFQITADHCVADDGRRPLNQVEVEYSGTLQKPMEALQEIDLDQEMSEIVLFLKQKLTDSNLQIASTETTKFDWIR